MEKLTNPETGRDEYVEESKTMDINKEAKQLRKQILWALMKAQEQECQNEQIEKEILQSFERICREQREECSEEGSKLYTPTTQGRKDNILNTPLLTDNK